MQYKDDSRVEMVQFHQSYAYEDFVQGWRPKEAGGFELKDGLFHRFCWKARADQEHPYVFIIDEVNRGNLSKIFGELLMLIEPDKRGPRYAIPLTYSRNGAERFDVPANVYLIGLMNTADRSLAMVDYALRRRFAFYSLKPELDSERFKTWLQSKGASAELVNKIRTRLGRINEAIGKNPHLGKGFFIGHSYFCPNDSRIPDEVWYREVIATDVAPLIREYWSDDADLAAQYVQDLVQ